MEKKQKIGVIVVVLLVTITIIGLTFSYEINAKMSYSAGDYIIYKVTSTWTLPSYTATNKFEIIDVEESSDGEILHIKADLDGDVYYFNNSRTKTDFDCNPLSWGYYSFVGIDLIQLKWGKRLAAHYTTSSPGEQMDLWTVQGLMVKSVVYTQSNSGPMTVTTLVFDSNIRGLTS